MFFFFKQKTAYEMRISDWSSDVCSSDLAAIFFTARWALTRWKWLEGAQLDMAGVLIILLLIAGSWLLFRAVAIIVIGLFADAIVAAVEGRHYPAAAARAVDVGWRQNIRQIGRAHV